MSDWRVLSNPLCKVQSLIYKWRVLSSKSLGLKNEDTLRGENSLAGLYALSYSDQTKRLNV